jgi:multidrug resistance efflux pump
MIESELASQKRVEAELALSRITHQRKAELYQEKAIPQQEFDVAENQLATSEAELAINQAEVDSARGEELAAQADLARLVASGGNR